jgi:hypothetical protein
MEKLFPLPMNSYKTFRSNKTKQENFYTIINAKVLYFKYLAKMSLESHFAINLLDKNKRNLAKRFCLSCFNF